MDLIEPILSTDSEDDDDELLARIKLVVMKDLLATSPLLSAFPELLGNQSLVASAHCSNETALEHNFEETKEDLSNEGSLKYEETILEEHLEEINEVSTYEDSVSDESESQLEETTSENHLGEFEEVLVNKSDYFEENIPGFALSDFEGHFRMSRACFANLMERLAVNGSVVGLQKKLLFTLCILSNEESFSSLARRFHMAKSTGHKSYCEVLDILCSNMASFIKWPSPSLYRSISRAFEEKSGWYIPGILGAIGSCLIQIRKPLENKTLYLDKKKNYSVILQGVCDNRGVFLNVYVGLPGGLQEDVAYQKNPLSAKLDSLIPVKCHLVGGLSYPLSKRLVTPFPESNSLLEKHRHFNARLNNARMAIRRAFSLLKKRFRRLKYLDVAEPMMANKIVSACCVLHNHIQSRSEDLEDVVIEIDDDDQVPSSEDSSSTEEGNASSGSSGKRNHLLSFF